MRNTRDAELLTIVITTLIKLNARRGQSEIHTFH